MRVRHLFPVIVVFAALAAAAAAAGPVSAAQGGPSRASVVSPAAGSGARVVVRASASRYGPVLVTGSGLALYGFSGDAFPFSVKNPPQFQIDCTALNTSPSGLPCTTPWPPLLATGRLVAGPGVRRAGLGTVTRDGVKQVTYFGQPLYTFVGDTTAGQVNGENVAAFKGVFWLVSPDGRPDPGAATVQTEVSPNGVVLAGATAGGTWRSLYRLTFDPPRSTTCTGACTAIWPPLLTSRAPRPGTGVRRSLLGVLRRPGGSLQVTYAGHPLYRFAFDLGAGAASGLTNGEDLLDSVQDGAWYTVSPQGTPDPGTATIGSEPSAGGQILSVTSGFTGLPVTLYAFTADTASSSACTGACAIFWPPVITSTPPKASGQAQASLLGVIPRRDGTFQVTYDGHPLYYFSKGLNNGTSGEGITAFGGTFHLVLTSGPTG